MSSTNCVHFGQTKQDLPFSSLLKLEKQRSVRFSARLVIDRRRRHRFCSVQITAKILNGEKEETKLSNKR